MKTALALIAIVLSAVPASAQEIPPAVPDTSTGTTTTQPEVAQPVVPPPPPAITPDTSLFKRSPVINGQIEPGEWDQYYSFDYNGVQVWTYVNWDDDNFYAASKSTTPTDLLVILDANNDSWFHGSDNYEFTARRAQGDDGPTLSVSRYESQRISGTSGAPLTAAEAAAFTMKVGSGPDSYVYELAIPRASAPGLELRPGKKIGLKVAVGIGSEDVLWIPEAPLGEVQTAELVTLKSSASDPLKLHIKLKDARIAPGEELVAKIIVENKGEIASPADTLVAGGEGKTAKLLGSQLVRIEGIKPGKSFTTTFRTPIPYSAPSGSGALGVEVRSGEERIAASLLSFDIVPAYEAKLDLSGKPDKHSDYRRIAVLIKNNTRRDAFGKVKLSLPEGWRFRWSEGVKEFHIRGEESEQAVVFRVKPPQKPVNRAPVLAEIQVRDQVISASGVIELK